MNEDDVDIAQIAELSRIRLTDVNEKKKQFLRVLDYIELLDEVDTQNVIPCTHVLETIVNVLREDEVGPLLPTKTFLDNAPDQVGGMIKTPPVIQFEEE